MAYALTQDLIHACGGTDRYVQLFDWNGDGVADVDVLERGALLVDGKIDGYARKRFTTPIANPSSTLRAFAAELMVFETRKIRGVMGDAEASTVEKSHRQWLDDLATGRISPSDPEPLRSTSSTVSIVENTSAVNRDELRGIL